METLSQGECTKYAWNAANLAESGCCNQAVRISQAAKGYPFIAFRFCAFRGERMDFKISFNILKTRIKATSTKCIRLQRNGRARYESTRSKIFERNGIPAHDTSRANRFCPQNYHCSVNLEPFADAPAEHIHV